MPGRKSLANDVKCSSPLALSRLPRFENGKTSTPIPERTPRERSVNTSYRISAIGRTTIHTTRRLNVWCGTLRPKRPGQIHPIANENLAAPVYQTATYFVVYQNKEGTGQGSGWAHRPVPSRPP